MIRILKLLLLSVLTVLLQCCNSKEIPQKEEIKEGQKEVIVSVPKVISERVAIVRNLSSEVKKLSEENISLHDLEIQVKKINTLRLGDFSGELKTIQENCNEFLKTMPKDFKNKSVMGRVDAIRTFAKAVQFEKKKGYKDTTKLYNYSKNLVASYNSLITQLNDAKNNLPDEVKASLQQTLEIKKDSVSGERPLF